MSKGIACVHETSRLRKQSSQTLFLPELIRNINLLTKIKLATNVAVLFGANYHYYFISSN